MGKRIVIALGGNALGKNLDEQMHAVKTTACAIADLIEDGHEVVIAHGNGPQVGMINLGMATAAEAKATYPEIKDYVLNHHGLKVSSLYIAQVKRKCGLEVGENYNLPSPNGRPQPQVPHEKEAAIRDALKYFAMI